VVLEYRIDLELTLPDEPAERVLGRAAELLELRARRIAPEARATIRAPDRIFIDIATADPGIVARAKETIARRGALGVYLGAPEDRLTGGLEALRAERARHEEALARGEDSPPPSLAILIDPSAPGGERAVELVGLERVQLIAVSATLDEFGKPAVFFRLAEGDAARFEELTGANIGRLLVFAIDGEIVTSATIVERLGGFGSLTGDFTPEDVEAMVGLLGVDLGAPPTLVRESPLRQ
jgi:preprotein translocase subunit SecD